MSIPGYMIYSVLHVSWVYAIPAHWVWGPNGWLSAYGFYDFAGTSTVHLVGGTAGLVLTYILKPRAGRFDESKAAEFAPNNVPFVVLGSMLLWFCWYGFNVGSLLTYESANATNNF